MSQEIVDLAREVLATLGTRDSSRLIALSDPEVEWHSFFALSEGGVYRGHDGTRPRPVADLLQASVINRDDDDVVGRARHAAQAEEHVAGRSRERRHEPRDG